MSEINSKNVGFLVLLVLVLLFTVTFVVNYNQERDIIYTDIKGLSLTN